MTDLDLPMLPSKCVDWPMSVYCDGGVTFTQAEPVKLEKGA